MAAQNTDLLTKLGLPGSATTLASPGHTIAGTSITVDSTSLWPTDTGVIFGMDTVTLVNGEEVRDVNSYTVWEGVVTSATGIGSMVLKYGTDQNYPAGSTTRVYILPSVIRENQVVDWGLEEHDQDGTHSDITATSVTATTGTFTNLTVSGTATSQGWTALGDVPDLVTANGNRNYDLRFDGVDHTSTLSPGMKLQLTRTVAAPSQCTSLNGTTQYYSKSSPSGMTFIDDFTVSAWVKLSSYNSGAQQVIASRYNGTSGWMFYVDTAGQIGMAGYNAGSANVSFVLSYASLPLNKWVHVAAQLDMSTFTASTTTSYIMFDGVDVAALVGRGGTNPTSLINNVGNLEIGGRNGGLLPFNGKIAQVAIYSAKVTQATIKASMDRTLTGSETSLISAYTFNNSLNDLNANANNLTAQGSATATNADSPFANAVTAGLLEYAEVNSVTFSTNTTVNVRVPDTCQIPTSGGVSAVSYSTQSNPYGLPAFSDILGQALVLTSASVTATTHTVFPGMTVVAYVPTGRKVKLTQSFYTTSNSAGAQHTLLIYDGSASAANQIQAGEFKNRGAGDATGGISITVSYIPTSGSHTFNGGFIVNTGTATTYATVNAPALFQVELV